MKDYVIMRSYKTNGILGSMKYIIIMLHSLRLGEISYLLYTLQ